MAQWINHDNIKLRPLQKKDWYSRRRWAYDWTADLPPTLEEGDTRYQFRSLPETDYGTTPCRWLPGLRPDDWVVSYLMHDYTHLTGGIWISHRTADGTWTDYVFVKIPKLRADKLLYISARAEGAPAPIAGAIYRGVRIGSPFVHYPE